MTTETNAVDTFLTKYYPKTLDGLVLFIDEMKDTGQIETLEDLRAELVKLSLLCREDGKYDGHNVRRG